MSTFRDRVLLSGKWTLIQQVYGNIIRLASNFFLARMLVPDDFALTATATVLILAAAMFSDVGFSESVIRSKRGCEADFLNTVWTAQILRGGILFIFAILTALILKVFSESGAFKSATVYAMPEFPLVFIITSMSLLIAGFNSTKLFEARRNLDIASLAKVDFICQTLTALLILLIVYIKGNAFTLAVGGVLSSLISLVMNHWLLPGQKNKLCWDRSVLKEVRLIGKWIALTSATGFLGWNLDKILLGFILPANVFGQYHIANQLASVVLMVFLSFSGGVFVPAFGEVVRDNPQNLKKVYEKFQRSSDILLFSTAGFLFVSGGSIVSVVYGQKYQLSGVFLSILAIGIAFNRSRVIESLFLIMDNGKRLLLPTAARAVALCVLIGVTWFYSPDAQRLLVLAVSFSAIAAWPFTLQFAVRQKLGILKPAYFSIPAFLIGGGLGYIIDIILRAIFL